MEALNSLFSAVKSNALGAPDVREHDRYALLRRQKTHPAVSIAC
jgi:hypothetical protein